MSFDLRISFSFRLLLCVAFAMPFLLASVLASPLAHGADNATAGPKEYFVYFGTYTRGGKSKGIYIYKLNAATGALTSVGVGTGVENPSFLAIHPNRRFLYAACEVADFLKAGTGAVGAFSLEPKTGALKLLNAEESKGGGPCHLVTDRDGKCVLVANYGGGSVAALPIRADGTLGRATSSIQHMGTSVNPTRQEGPHAHSINVDPENHFAVAADLGLDKLLVYKLDAEKGVLTPNNPPFTAVAGGSGPRHFAFHPSGQFAYVINEMTCTVTAFSFDAKAGTLKELQTLTTLPMDRKEGFSTAEVQVHPSGKFLYGSNRGHDSIAIFTIDQQSGKLTAAGHQSTGGKTPRNFGIDPSGNFLLAANQSSDNVVVFAIDPQTGALKAANQEISVPSPVCVKFVPVPEN